MYHPNCLKEWQAKLQEDGKSFTCCVCRLSLDGEGWKNANPEAVAFNKERATAISRAAIFQGKQASRRRVVSSSSRGRERSSITVHLPQCGLCGGAFGGVNGPMAMVRLACRHTFHFSCCNSWFQVNDACPICKAQVRVNFFRGGSRSGGGGGSGSSRGSGSGSSSGSSHGSGKSRGSRSSSRSSSRGSSSSSSSRSSGIIRTPTVADKQSEVDFSRMTERQRFAAAIAMSKEATPSGGAPRAASVEHPPKAPRKERRMWSYKTQREREIDSKPCEECLEVDLEQLLCCRCDDAYHLGCVHLTAVPKGTWLCKACAKDLSQPTSLASSPPPAAASGASHKFGELVNTYVSMLRSNEPLKKGMALLSPPSKENKKKRKRGHHLCVTPKRKRGHHLCVAPPSQKVEAGILQLASLAAALRVRGMTYTQGPKYNERLPALQLTDVEKQGLELTKEDRFAFDKFKEAEGIGCGPPVRVVERAETGG